MLNPAELSPKPKPLMNISKAPVTESIALVTPGMFALLIAVLTSDNAVPPGVIVSPLMTKVLPLVTVVPDATVNTGCDKCHALEPTCTQLFESFL